MKASAPLHNIIFDLGGVIIDLDIPRTQQALAALGVPDELLDYSCSETSVLFRNYESGLISSNDFRDKMRQRSGLNFSDEVFDEAWSKMLVGVNPETIDLLLKLKKTHRIFLLSNTSPIHALRFEDFFMKTAGVRMADCFEKRYYSFETGLHKPDPEAFLLILKENRLLAKECLFIDDTEPNVKAAEALGFNTLLLKPGMQLNELPLLEN